MKKFDKNTYSISSHKRLPVMLNNKNVLLDSYYK